MLPYKRGIVQNALFSSELTTSNQGGAELSDEENAEIHQSFSNLQVSPRESYRGYNGKMEEENGHLEQIGNRYLSKMGLVNFLI